MKKEIKNDRLEIRIPASHKKALQECASHANMSVSELITQLIESKLLFLSHEQKTQSLLIINRICNFITNLDIPETSKQTIEKELRHYVEY